MGEIYLNPSQYIQTSITDGLCVDLNVKSKTIQFLENIREHLHDLKID